MSAREKASTLFDLWKEFLPLSVSDVTMACGDPMITTTLARMPQATANLGALGAVKAIAVFFESPVIMLLHASNTLAPSQTSRKSLYQFMLILCGLLTSILCLLCIPPVFDFFVGIAMKLPPDIKDGAKESLVFFILWPAAIGWRRYYQGLLIRGNHTRALAHAGFVRLLVVGIVLAIGFFLNMRGILLAATALISGVLFESVVVTVSARNSGATKLPVLVRDPRLPGSLKEVWRFYWPLANSMLVVWGGRVLLLAVVARSFDASIALAAWPAAWGFVLMVANATRMIQQVIIKNINKVDDKLLLTFAASVGALFTLILIFFSATTLGKHALSAFVGQNSVLADAVSQVILVCSTVPFLVACQNAVQGFLMTEHKTTHINVATWLGTGVLLSVAFIGTRAGISGATAAAWAMIMALAVEAAWLSHCLRPIFSARKNAIPRAEIQDEGVCI